MFLEKIVCFQLLLTKIVCFEDAGKNIVCLTSNLSFRIPVLANKTFVVAMRLNGCCRKMSKTIVPPPPLLRNQMDHPLGEIQLTQSVSECTRYTGHGQWAGGNSHLWMLSMVAMVAVETDYKTHNF